MDTTFLSLHFNTKSCVSRNFGSFSLKQRKSSAAGRLCRAAASSRFLMEKEDLKFSIAIHEQRWKVKANE